MGTSHLFHLLQDGRLAIILRVKQLRVNVVVTCTARKTQPVPKSRMMRNFRRDDLRLRFENWQSQLNHSGNQRKRVLDLYCGNSWSVVRNLCVDSEIGRFIRIWVVSAGYGLVGMDELVTSYAATFSKRERDSVIPRDLDGHSATDWWKLLVQHKHERGDDITSVTDIALRYPRDPLITVLSNDYFKAVSCDLECAASKMVDSDRLVIIAAGALKTGKLANNFLPCDARLEHVLGKSRMALNARILQLILAQFPPADIRATRLKSFFEPLLLRLPKSEYPLRTSSDDQTVAAYIRKELMARPDSKHTNLLKAYRATGRACEQKRFRSLFRREASKLNAKNIK